MVSTPENVFADPSIDAVLTLNSAVAAVAVQSLADAGSDAAVATFDLNQDVISGIQDGSIAFAVDQQQYEQLRAAVDRVADDAFAAAGTAVAGRVRAYQLVTVRCAGEPRAVGSVTG